MSTTFCRRCKTKLEGIHIICPNCEMYTSGEETPIPKKYMGEL